MRNRRYVIMGPVKVTGETEETDKPRDPYDPPGNGSPSTCTQPSMTVRPSNG